MHVGTRACVFALVRVYMRACMCAFVCVFACVRAFMHECVCVRAFVCFRA